MRSLFFGFCCLFGFPGVASAQSFISALQKAYQSSDELSIQIHNLSTAKTERSLQQLYWVPSLKFSLNVNNENKVQEDGTRYMAGFKGVRQLGIESLIFRSGQIFSISAADKKFEIALLGLKLTEEKLFFDVLTAYAGILNQTQAVKLSVTHLEKMKKERDTLAVKVETKSAAFQDLLMSEAYVSKSKVRLSSARALLKEYRTNYENLIGKVPDRLESSIDVLGPEYVLSNFDVLETLEESVVAFKLHDKSYKMVVARNQLELDQFKSVAFGNNVELSAGAYSNWLINNNVKSEDKKSRYIGFQASIKLPLLQPLVISALNSFTRSKSSNILLKRMELKRDFEISWRKLQESKLQVKYLQDLAKSQALYVAALLERIDSGMQSPKDYIHGLNDLLDARVNLLKARTSHLTLLYKLIFSTNSIEI